METGMKADPQRRLMTREESIEIYKAHSKRLFNISLRIVRDSALAEEIMQDTILKYLQSGPLCRTTAGNRLPVQGAERRETAVVLPAVQSAWMTRTCIRASIDALRKRKREKKLLEEYAAEEAPEYFAPVNDVQNSEMVIPDVKAVKSVMDRLPDPYRLILNLVLIDGLDYEEISGLTGEKEGTVRTRYSRARQMLASMIKEYNTLTYNK
jgi:RNA polymerase sigma-70 factor (ECF subfamily)